MARSIQSIARSRRSGSERTLQRHEESPVDYRQSREDIPGVNRCEVYRVTIDLSSGISQNWAPPIREIRSQSWSLRKYFIQKLSIKIKSFTRSRSVCCGLVNVGKERKRERISLKRALFATTMATKFEVQFFKK